MKMPVIYAHSSATLFINEYYNTLKKVDPTFSLRKWAKQMGLNSHSIISLILQRKRPIKTKHAEVFAKGMKLSSNEKLYLKALIQYENASSLEDKELTSLWLSKLNPGDNFSTKEIEDYRVISDWAYATILTICCLSTFEGTISDIHKRIAHKLTFEEVRSKVLRLLDLGLLEEKENKLCSTFKKTTTKDDVRNAGVREYHKQACRLAIEAVDTLDIDQREFQSYAVSMSKENMKRMKEVIRSFISTIAVETKGPESNEVYQFNIQFFQLTQSSPSKEKMEEASTVVTDSTQLTGEK